VVEDLGLAGLRRGDEVLVQDLEDVLADLGELGLDLLAVLLDEGDLRLVALGLLLLLDGGDDPPGGAAGTDDVLVCDGQQIPLLDGELGVGGGDGLHVLNHLCMAQISNDVADGSPAQLLERGRGREGQLELRTLIALGLLGKLRQVDGIFLTHDE
jgi:hypothetical protein